MITRPHSSKPFDLEALEPRIMLSADGADILGLGAAVIVESMNDNVQDDDVLSYPDAMEADDLFSTTYEAVEMTAFGEPAPASADHLSLGVSDRIYLGTLMPSQSDFAVRLAPDAEVSGQDISSMTVTITGGEANDRLLIFGNTDGSEFGISWAYAGGEMTLTGTAPAEDYQTLLRTLAYQSTQPATASSADRTIEIEATLADSSTQLDDFTLRMAQIDGGIEGVFESLDAQFQLLFGHFFTDSGIFDFPNESLVSDDIRESTDIIPYINSNFRDLMFPQRFVPVDGDGNTVAEEEAVDFQQRDNYEITLQPWDVGRFFDLGDVFNFGPGGSGVSYTTLDQIAQALETHYTQIAQTVLDADTWEISVKVLPLEGADGFTLEVVIAATKDVGDFQLELGLLQDDLGIRLVDDLTFGAGGGVELSFRLDVDLSGHLFDDTPISSSNTVLTFDHIRGTAGFQFEGETLAVEIGMLRGEARDVSGRLFGSLPMAFTGDVQTRNLGSWTPGHFGNFFAGGGEIQLVLPIHAELFGQTVTEPDTAISVFVEDIFENTPPVYTAVNYERLQAFALLETEDVIQSILDVEDLFRLLQNGGEDLFGIPLPFLENINLGEVFTWALMFSEEIGQKIDINEILLVTPGSDAMADIRTDPDFRAEWLFPSLFPAFATDALLRNEMKFAFIVNGDLSNYVEIVVPESSSRNTLDDLVTVLNTILNDLGGFLGEAHGGVMALNISESLAFYAPANSGIDSLHLVPHPDAPGDLKKFALMNEELTFLDRQQGNGWTSTFKLDPDNPLVTDASISMTLDGQTEVITLARIPGESASAMLVRLATAIHLAFGSDKIALFALQEDVNGDLISVASPDQPFFIRLEPLENGANLELNLVNINQAAGVLALGFFVGDNASTPRPENLRTFQDFVDGAIVGRTPDLFAYDPATNVVSLGYYQPLSPGISLERDLNLRFSFPSVSQISPDTAANLTVTIDANLGFGFVIEFLLTPSEPITFNSGGFTSSDSYVLSEDAEFTVNFVLGNEYDIVVSSSDTTSNVSLQDLVGDINSGLRLAVRTGSGDIVDLTGDTLVARVLVNAIQLTNAIRLRDYTNPFSLSNDDGELPEDTLLSFDLNGNTYLLPLRASDTEGFTNFGQLIAYINSQMSTVFMDMDGSGTISDGDVVVSLAGTVFATTYGNTDEAFHIFTTGPPQPHWTFSANLLAEAGSVVQTELKFNGPTQGGQLRITSSVDGVQTRIRGFDGVDLQAGADLVFGNLTYSLPTDVSGSFRLGFNEVDFSSVLNSGSFNASVAAAVAGEFTSEDLLSSPADTLETDIADYPPNFWLELSGLSSSAETIDSSAGIRLTIEDFTLLRVEQFRDFSLPLPLFNLIVEGGVPTGRLNADTTLTFFHQGTKYEVAVTAAATAGNTTFTQLIDQFNQALAQATVDGITETTFDISGEFRFRAERNLIQTQVLIPVPNPDYITLDILPDLAAYGAIGAQTGFSTQAVVDGLFLALASFEEIFLDPDGFFSSPLPIINTPMNQLWYVPGDFAARIQNLQNNPASSADLLPNRIAQAFGLSASEVSLEWDEANSGYRIEFAFLTGTVAQRPVDINPAFFAQFAENGGDGLDRLIDGANRSPATFQGIVTFNIALGIDLSDPAAPRFFLYEHDGSEDAVPENGTSISVDFNIYADGIDFTSSKKALGLFIRDGIAILAGEASEVNGQTAYIQRENRNRTPYLLHLLDRDFANITLYLGNTQESGADGKFYLGETAGSGERNFELEALRRDITGSVQVVLPIYTPTEMLNPFTNRQVTGITLVDLAAGTATPGTSGVVGGNVFELRIYDLGGFVDDSLAWSEMSGAEKGAVIAGGNVEIYVPDPESDAGIQMPTLLDLLRDPALILDGIDFFFGIIQAGLAGVGSLPIPIVGEAFQGAANMVFSFRDGWLRDMRNRLRGAGEAFGQLVKESIFQFLGPDGAGILLQLNGISGLDGQVQAGSPDDIIFDWLDSNGNSLTNMGGYGAHGFEFQIRLGQLLFETGFSSDLNFDALAPVISLGLDGGFGFAVGWDLQIGFGFNLDDGFYIKVDGDRNELEIRVEGTLRGAQEHFEIRAVNDPELPPFPSSDFGTGYAIWNRRDEKWVLGPAKGDGSRLPIHVINVDEDGNVVDPSEWESNLVFGSAFLGGSSCNCQQTLIGVEEPDLYWVVAAFDEGANRWAPAYLDMLGQFRPQTGSFDPAQMILYDRAQPFTAFGSLFFLNLEASDQFRIGLEPPGDADYYFGIDEDQKSPNDRNDADEGVRRNNHLPSRARASIGINLWDPSEQSEDNAILFVGSSSITGWSGADWNGEIITDLGLSFVEENADGFPVIDFLNVWNADNSDAWFIIHLVDEDNADDIRDYFNELMEENGWTLEVERRASFSSSTVIVERVSIVDGVWSYLDGDDEWRPVFEEDWTFFIRVEDEFGGGSFDLIRVKYIQLGDDYYDIVENGTGWYIVDPDYSGVAGGAQSDNVNGLLEPIFLFDEIDDSWDVPLFMLLSTSYSLNDLASDGYLKTDTFPGRDGNMPVGFGSDITNLVRWGYWLPVRPIDFDASENMITWEELRGSDSSKIIQLKLSADVIINLSLELSVSDNAAFPKITADINLDWGIDVNFFDDDPFGAVNWYPHVGMNNIRLDMGSFLTQYLRPVLEQIDEGLSPIRPVIEVLTDPIPVISDIAGRNISLSTLLYQFGGPKGQAIATFIDVVRLVSDLSAMVAALPDDMNVYLPIGNFWIPSGKDGLENDIYYDNSELTPPSFSQQNQALIGDDVEQGSDAFGFLNDTTASNQPNNGITNNSKKGGFGFPILEDPTQLFSLLMGGDAVLVTYSLPQLDFSFSKRIPLIQLGPFQAGIRFGFDITAQLHFGFDTYGIRKVMDTGNPLWAIDGLYISDRQNADGTGRDVPEVTMTATIALYGGVDIFLARGGIEGGFRVGIEIDLNDPNDDGKVRPSELLAVVEWTGNPLDWFNIRIYGEVYARYYYKVMIPVPYPFGIKRITILEGGKTFARLTLFDIQWEGSKGPPILGEKINFVTPKGELVENALLINMGPNSENRITNDDPWYSRADSAILDGNEKFVITNSGNNVTVTLYDRSGQNVVHSMTFNNVSMVVAYAGEGNDIIDASGLNGIPVYFEGIEGNNQITVGSTHATRPSWVIGGTGDDTLNVINGGYTYFSGVSGSNAISLADGNSSVNVVQAGRDRDEISDGGSGAENTILFSTGFGEIDLSGVGLSNTATTLDFSRTFFPLSGEMSGANSFIEAGGRSRVVFHLAAMTQIKGSQNRDTFTFRTPQTHTNGLLLRGGLGNDLFTFVLGNYDDVAAAGITIDHDIRPTTEALVGEIELDDCGGIAEISLASNLVGGELLFESGSGYLVAPEVRIVDATGTGARAIAALNTDGTIAGIVMTSRGTGYTNPTVELVNRTSFNDTVRFVLEDTTDLTQAMTLNRVSDGHTLTYEGKTIRMTDTVENIVIEAPGAVVSAGLGGIDLDGRFQLRAERFIHTGSITADTVLIVTDQGFAVDHPISTLNHGNISLEVLGRGDRAAAIPVISGSRVVGYTLTDGGSFYNFTPQVVVRGGSAGTGSGAFAEGSVNSQGQVTGFTVLQEGFGYSSIPVPDAYITSPSSIYLNASLSSSALGSPAGYGDGRGTITLRALEGSVLTSADVVFPADSQIVWEKGDFRFTGNLTLDDIQSGGSGAVVNAVIDSDGRVVDFEIVNGGSGYSSDYLPTVRIQGAAEATAVVENGAIVGFNITNPGGGYALAPQVLIRSNGLSKIADGPTRHIKAANGFLVIDTDSGVGTIHRPVQTDVRVFVAQSAMLGDSNIYILENDGFDIGAVDGINGVTANSSDIHLVSFSGDINLGMPVQRTNSAGDLLWQDAEKTIPIYETYQTRTVIGGREFLPGDLVYVGGNLNAQSGNIVMVADNFNVNAVVSSTGATLLSLRPSDPTATLGLAGSRAIAEAVLDANGTVIGLNLLWQGRGYTGEPLVIFNAPGDRAFAVATTLNGSVSGIEVTYGGTFYNQVPDVILSAPNLTGGVQATARAIVRNGEVVGIEILNAGSGYTSAPRVNIALPGQQATARAQVQNGRVVGFFDLSGGTNYTFVPRVTVEQPFTFGLDQFEIDFFQAGFDNFEVGRADGRNRVVTATQQFQETTILRGDSHFFEDTFVAGDLIVYGSGNTSFFNTGTTEADSITFNDALIINPGQTHTFRATAGGILFQLPGTVNGTLPNSGINPANQENVILDATGNIQIVGAIGNNAKIHNLTILNGANITFNDTVTLSGNLIIENGAQITFERDVRIDGNLIIGSASDLSRIGSVTFTPGARLDVQGDIEIYSEGAVNFRNDVGQVFSIDSMTVVSGGLINFEGRLTADQVDLTAGNDHDIYFNQPVLVQDMHARAGNLIRVDSTITVGTGNLTLTGNRLELLGGSGSIRNQTGTSGVSTLTIQPFTASRNMAVGAPVFFFGEEGDRLNITYQEIAAINTGFFEVIFGDILNGTGDVFVSDLGSTRNNFTSSPPPIQNPTTIVGGRVQVGYADDPDFFDADISDVFEFIQPSEITVTSSASYLRFKSLVTDVRIDAAINTFTQRNPWIRIEAERDIIINKPVQALTRISLTSGYSGAIAGSVTVNSTGGHTGHLFTTSSTTPNHRIEISAGRVGGATGGNIVFTDVPFTGAGGDVTVWARNAGGRVLMQAPGGSITQNHGLIRAEILSLTASGNISLDLTDAVRVGEGTIDGVTLWRDGFVKDNGLDVFIDGIIITGSGNLIMTETDDLILDNVQTNGGDITIDNLVDSEGDLHLGTLGAVSGTITLTADGAMTDNLAGDGIINLTTSGLADLTARTGIGGPGVEDIDTLIGSLTAQTTVSGGIHIDERNGLVIAGPVTTAGNGPILLSLRDGNLQVNHAITADGAGNILLETLNGSVTLDAAVSSGTGHITVLAEDLIELLANGSLSTGTPGTLYLASNTGEFVMDSASTITAADSSIFITTLGTDAGDIYLSSVTGQRVSVVSANFSIFSANQAVDNVTAVDLRLEASRAIGTGSEPLNTAAENLAASAGGDVGPIGMFLSQKGDVTVGEIAPVLTQIVDTENELTEGGDTSALADLRTGNAGPLVLVADGSVTLNDDNENGAAVAAHTSGNVLIRAIGEEADLTLNGNVLSGTGHISLIAERDIFQNADVITGTPGTVFVEAENGGLVMDQDAVIQASDSSILVRVEQDATLGLLEATNVSVKSFAGSIFSTKDTTLNVDATNLRLEAGNAIGQASAPLLLDISNLTAHAASQSGTDKGIYLQNEGSVTVTAVEVSVERVLANASTSGETESSQADLVTDNDGNIVLTTVDGTITLTDANGNGFAISATGSGEVVLTANGTDRDILAETDADIRAGTGDISLTAHRNILLNAANVDFVTSGEGEIALTATIGEIFMTDGSTIQSRDGDISLDARLNISLSLIQSETGDMTLYSRESAIIDNTLLEEPNLVTGGHLAMKAATGIGATGVADINTLVRTLTAINSVSGLIVITEETDLIIDVSTDEPFAPDYDSYGILNEATGGSILIRTLDGSITVNAPIEAAAEGHILLQVNGDENDLEVNAAVTAEEGSITLENTGDGDVLVNAMITSTENGNIYIVAVDGSIRFNENGGATTVNQNIALIAQVDVEVTGVNAGSGNVTIHAITGAISDAGGNLRDVTADYLKLRAAESIGAGEALETEINRLAALSANGEINVTNLGSLLIEEIPVISYNKVLLNNTLEVVDDGAPLNNVVADMDITLVSETGSLTIRDPFSTENAISSNSGNIALTAEIDVLQNASIFTAAGEKIEVTAATGNIIMAYDADNDVGTLTYGPQAEITYTAAGDILLSTLRSDSENITVDAGDRIADNRSGDEDPNILTPALATLNAVNGIGGLGLADINLNVGSVTGTNTTSGRIVLREVDTLEIASGGLTTQDGNGDIIVTVEEGPLTVNGLVSAHGSGNILLETIGTDSDIELNANVVSTNGHITFQADRDIDLADSVTITTNSPGTILVEAFNGALRMAATAAVTASSSSIRLRAEDDVTLGVVSATSISVKSENGAIIKAEDSLVNLTSENLRLEANGSIGMANRHLEIFTENLSALSETGGIFLTEQGGVTVTTTRVEVREFRVDGSFDTVITDFAQSDLTTLDNGDIVLVALTGNITLNDGDTGVDQTDGDNRFNNDTAVSANGAGSILLQAEQGTVTANASIFSGSGLITFKASEDILLNAGVEVKTAGSDISMDAEGGSLTMIGNVEVEANGATVRLRAQDTVTVANVTGADVSILALDGAIVNASGSTKNVTATNLRLEAKDDIGTADRHLTTNIDNVSALSREGGLFITEDNGATVTSVRVDWTEFKRDAQTDEFFDAAQSDLVTQEDGDIILVVQDGDLILNDGNTGIDQTGGDELEADGIAVSANGTGSILLHAGLGSVIANASILSGSGLITIKGGVDVALNEDVEIKTNGSDISIDAETGNLTMDGSVEVEAADATVRLRGKVNVTVANVTGADVSILAEDGAIVNAEDSTKNVTATNLRLEAEGNIGTAIRHLNTNITNLSALSRTGGIFITEDNGATVTSVRLDWTEFERGAETGTHFDAAQSDLITESNGDIILVVQDGDLVLEDGDDKVNQDDGDEREADGIAVSANGIGSILLQAELGSVTVNGSILSDTGLITIKADVNVTLNEGVEVKTAGSDISIDAENGKLTMDGSVEVEATGATVRLRAQDTVTVANITGADVSILAEDGAIVNASGSTKNVTATNLRLEARGDIGTPEDHLTTNITNLSTLSREGGIFITEDNGAVVTSVRVDWREFERDAQTDDFFDAAQSDLITLEDGDIILVVQDGNLVLEDGNALVDQDEGDGREADGIAVSANGTGSILLQAGLGSVIANASILSGSGLITIKGGVDVALNEDVEVKTNGSDISIDAVAGSLTMDGSVEVEATNAVVRLRAGVTVTVANVTAVDVSILAEDGAIVNASGSTKNVVAVNLRLEAEGDIGTSGRQLATTITNLSALSREGGIFITEDDGVVVTSVRVDWIEFERDAETGTHFDAAQSDLVTEANGDIVLVVMDGDVTLEDGDTEVSQTGGDDREADGVAIRAGGNGSVRVEAVNGSVTVNASVTSGTGNIRILADQNLSLNENVVVETAIPGYVFFVADKGTVDMDETVEVSGEAIRIEAGLNIILATLEADGDVSLISRAGALVSADAGLLNVTADRLRMEAVGNVGPLRTQVNVLAVVSREGFVELVDLDTVTLGTVETTIGGRTDAAIHGIRAKESISLMTLSGRILDGGNLNGDDVISENGPVTLIGAEGLGAVGGGALDISTPLLSAETTSGGSVYLNLTRDTEVSGITLGGQGHLYLSVNGTLNQTGDIQVPNGSAFITISENYLGSGLLAVSRDLRITAVDMILSEDAAVVAETGNIQLRADGDLVMTAVAHVHAVTGDLRIVTGGNLTAALLEAGRLVDLRVAGNLDAASEDRSTHELRATALRLVVQGVIEPILTRTARLDVRAGGVREIFEYDDLTAGRFGFQLVDPGSKDEFVLRMGTGVLDSLREDIRIQDDVVFVLLSEEDAMITLDTAIVLPEGDIRVNVDGMDLDPGLSGVMLSAAEGDVILNVKSGVGSELQRLVVDAETFTARALEGGFVLRFVTPVEISSAGVEIQSGSGAVNILVEGGDLVLDGTVRHLGNGMIRLTVEDGALALLHGGSAAHLTTGGQVNLDLDSGITAPADGRMNIDSGSFSAVTQTGNLRLNLLTATQIATGGVSILDGSGVLDLRVATGNLTMAANALIRNMGSGHLNIHVVSGAFTMGGTNEVRTSGDMAILVHNTFTVGRLFSLGGSTVLTSETGSLLRAQGSTGGNLGLQDYSSHVPVLNYRVSGTLWLTVNIARVNGDTLFRPSDKLYLILS